MRRATAVALAATALAGSLWLGAHNERGLSDGPCSHVVSVDHPSEDSIVVRVPTGCTQVAPLTLCQLMADANGVPNAVVVQGDRQIAGCYR